MKTTNDPMTSLNELLTKNKNRTTKLISRISHATCRMERKTQNSTITCEEASAFDLSELHASGDLAIDSVFDAFVDARNFDSGNMEGLYNA